MFHPLYNSGNYERWRLTYEAGEPFIYRYLFKYNSREDAEDFKTRQQLTYCPAFAKAGVNELKNSIYQRTVDIVRNGGPKSYQSAITGQNRGVDLKGASMNYFIGQKVLPELLPMSKVGVFVDAPNYSGPTKLDKGSAHPYLYIYSIENIISWEEGNDGEYQSVLLRDCEYGNDVNTGLPAKTDKVTKYRLLTLTEDGVVFQWLNDAMTPVDDPILLNLNRLPVVMFDIGCSLLQDVCNYQIALMNLESSDLSFAIFANFVFFVEQFDPRLDSQYIQSDTEDSGKQPEVEVGPRQGRQYPLGTEQPAFINPSAEPLKASMLKGQQMKDDIRALINLSVSQIDAKKAIRSDKSPLEAGLSSIGMILEDGERKIANIWAQYEGSLDYASVFYPEDYSLPDPKTTQDQNDHDSILADKIPSPTFKREIIKRIMKRSIGNRLSADVIQKMNSEIDSASVIIADVDSISTDMQNGLISNETASVARGYPKGEAEKAKQDRAERIAAIQAAQTSPSSRGLNDLSIDTGGSKAEKQVAIENGKNAPTPTDPTRGFGK